MNAIVGLIMFWLLSYMFGGILLILEKIGIINLNTNEKIQNKTEPSSPKDLDDVLEKLFDGNIVYLEETQNSTLIKSIKEQTNNKNKKEFSNSAKNQIIETALEERNTDNKSYIKRVRIYEVAKELGISSKEVLSAAKEMKIEVKSAQNTINVKQAESLKKYILDGNTQSFKENRKSKNKSIEKISIETINYSNAIRNIEVPNFEKVRRCCNNLVKNNQADEMQADLANNGKMHKALVYDALEQFIEQLQLNTIDIVDWGAGQGIYSMLIVDYIREKQLDINVGNVILIDNDATVLSRAIAQVNVLAQEDTNVSSLTMNKAKSIKDFKLENRPLHIFANDKIDMDLPKKAFEKEAYYMCLSNDNENFVQKIHTKISSLMNGSEIITNRKAKVGRFQKFEIIFKSPEISFFDIDEDEIPF